MHLKLCKLALLELEVCVEKGIEINVNRMVSITWDHFYIVLF